MLSEELTTGSVTTTIADKKAYATRSHAWNITNKKFKEAFPDVSTMLNTLSFPILHHFCPLSLTLTAESMFCGTVVICPFVRLLFSMHCFADSFLNFSTATQL